MISSKDRSGWIGASDTSYVVGNWNTKSFKKWYLEKLGLRQNTIETKAMKCGNAFEHKILDVIGCEMDMQLLFPELKLRVNYDGNTKDTIYEVKTHRADKEFKITKGYWRQAQVEMLGFKLKFGFIPKLYITSYALSEREYKNYFSEIDKEKIQYHEVEYDESFIEEYLKKLDVLSNCMNKGIMP